MQRTRQEEFALILNENARRVSRRVLRSAQDLAPRIALYTSRTKEDAYHAIKDVMDRGYRRIICGGGDGTFYHMLSQTKRYLEEQNARLQSMGHQARQGLARVSFPEFGILKLGTGNSLAPILGIKRGLRPLRWLARGQEFATRRVNVIESDDRCFLFCGVGWDAQILNDYLWLKERSSLRFLAHRLQNVFGYIAAILLRTIPKVVLGGKRASATVRNLGDRLYRIRRDGGLDAVDCPAGEVFYDGPCHAMGAATTPYYGYRLKAFPDAMKLPGFMQVRIVKAGVAELVAHAPTIWKGTYRSGNFIDYLAEKVHCTFSQQMPLQIGGDAEGYRGEIALQVSDATVDLLDFRRPARL